MKKFSLKDTKVINKVADIVDEMLDSNEFMSADPRKYFYNKTADGSWFRPNSLNMPSEQSITPETNKNVPDPLLEEKASDGEPVIIDGMEVHNPEYVYDVDLPIYTLPEKTGDGYAPIQREIDPQFSNGYAPGTKTQTEMPSSEETCACGEEELLEDAEVAVIEIIPEKIEDAAPTKPKEVFMEDETIKEYLPSTPTWNPLLWKE